MNHDEAEQARRDRLLRESITRMSQTPGSGIRMCHAQGKTAVYLSEDGKFIVEHPPHGPITRTPLPEESL